MRTLPNLGLRPTASRAHTEVALVYNGRDVSADLAPYLMEVIYTDRLTGEADSLDVRLASPSALDTRWLADWYPDKGVVIEAGIGYRDGAQVATGQMEVDEVDIEAPPLAVSIRALAAGISRQARTRLGNLYEHMRLSQIVDAVAARLGAKRVGKIEPDPLLDRVTQYKEGDWAFLYRLLAAYGYAVKLAGNNGMLAVARAGTLAAQDAAAILTPALVSAWRYRDKVSDVPRKVELRHYDPAKGALTVAEKATGGEYADDVRISHRRVRSSADAQAQAAGEAERLALDKAALAITLPGDPCIVAGSVVALDGFLRLDGRYLVTEARHTVSRAGYTLEIDTKRLPDG